MKKIKDIHGHVISRNRVTHAFITMDEERNEQRIKIQIKTLGECGQKTVFLEKGPAFLSKREVKRIIIFIMESNVDLIKPDDIKDLLYSN